MTAKTVMRLVDHRADGKAAQAGNQNQRVDGRQFFAAAAGFATGFIGHGHAGPGRYIHVTGMQIAGIAVQAGVFDPQGGKLAANDPARLIDQPGKRGKPKPQDWRRGDFAVKQTQIFGHSTGHQGFAGTGRRFKQHRAQITDDDGPALFIGNGGANLSQIAQATRQNRRCVFHGFGLKRFQHSSCRFHCRHGRTAFPNRSIRYSGIFSTRTGSNATI